MAGSQPRNYRNARDDEQKLKNHRGIVSVVDLELLADNRDQPIHNRKRFTTRYMFKLQFVIPIGIYSYFGGLF